nr:MAG TPA: hypothetical protein [Caudoviricetes sp.]
MPATRTERPTPPAEPPATGILLAAAAVCETRGIHHLAKHLGTLRDELTSLTECPELKTLSKPNK